MTTSDQADVLIIGGGMAGMTAGARAASHGARVVVVEISSRLGGSAELAGYAWTAPDREVIDRVDPRGDESLRHKLVDDFEAGVDWIRSLGVETGPPVEILRFGRGYQFDTMHYIDACKARVKESGEVLTNTRTSRLLTSGDRVVGAEVVRADGETRQVTAAATVLATGGFQGDADLVAQHVHPAAAAMPLRSNPHSRGGGLKLALQVGAAFAGSRTGFYGHLIPTGVSMEDPADFIPLSLYYSEHALLFNIENKRFVDETQGDHLTTMALLEQPESRGLLVADARVHRDWIVGSYVEGAESTDKFALTTRRGGRCGLAESLDEIALVPDDWGYDGEAIRLQIETVNEAAHRGIAAEPGRQYDSAALDEPPFYLIECRPAITFPFSGVSVDDQARAQRPSGDPIPGLFAAGSDTGGLYVGAYAGGLASALVFGLAAADSALAELESAN